MATVTKKSASKTTKKQPANRIAEVNEQVTHKDALKGIQKVAVKNPKLGKELHSHFGFDSFKGNQEDIIESILSGKDTFVIMPTGGGKSMCYQLPALMLEGTAIIISPLIALMKNQVDAIRSYGENDAVAHFLNSSLTKVQAKNVKDDIKAGNTKMLYVAPETLTKEENIEFFKGIKVSFVAVDEAHCISEWGHDFRPEYRRIKEMIKNFKQRIPLVALTATATPKVQSDILKNLGMNKPDVFISSFNRPNLMYEVQPKRKKEETIKEIIKFVRKHNGKSGIIYTLSRKMAEEIAQILSVNGIKAVAYHAGLEAAVRSQRQDWFLMQEVDVIVATIAFGMGIDKPDVRFVIHYNFPKSLENYYQETGRAGRDGLEGICRSYYSYNDLLKLEKFMRDKPMAERELGGQLLMEMEAFAETSVCRRKFILHYFGENLQQENCGMCDNCVHPKEHQEGKDFITTVLKTVKSVGENYGIDYIVKIICGKKDQQIVMFGHDKIKEYGSGKAHDEHFWSSIVRHALINNFIRKDIEQYGLLKFTNEGKEFLKKPSSVMVTVNHNYEVVEDTDDDDVITNNGGGGGALDTQLLKMLKDLVKQVAKEKKLPPFVIFQEPSINDMATMYPTTLQELENCQGVSKGKAVRYGKPFVELIAKYVEENNIDRPLDFLIKTVANKSAAKVQIIQNIDKKIPLDEIARQRAMSMVELVTELETIVASGTKLNLSYYINEHIDEYTQEEIFDYFKHAETDDIATAVNELGKEDFDFEQVQLMRLKFMSELGN
ncbi:MAG: helicase RecQ [Bacteroidota bacterium]|jgi:ATP-dependent DNA helicase RecQ